MLETPVRYTDGAIFLGCHGSSRWLAEYADRYPLVQCCEYVPELNAPSVSIDNYAAAVETVGYLHSLGHTRIAMLSAANDFISTKLRLQGYADALERAGLSYSPELVESASADYSYASGLQKSRRQKDFD